MKMFMQKRKGGEWETVKEDQECKGIYQGWTMIEFGVEGDDPEEIHEQCAADEELWEIFLCIGVREIWEW